MTELPDSLKDIAELIGREAALDLAAALGGQKLYIPRPEALDLGHRIVQVIGLEDASRLAAAWQGEAFDVPFARCCLAERLLAQGLSNREIASRLHLSVRTVQRYRRLAQERDR